MTHPTNKQGCTGQFDLVSHLTRRGIERQRQLSAFGYLTDRPSKLIVTGNTFSSMEL